MLVIIALGVVIVTVEVSILYLRCTLSGPEDWYAFFTAVVSILYLRCPQSPSTLLSVWWAEFQFSI